jgi:lysophospholipase L1-like esterase
MNTVESFLKKFRAGEFMRVVAFGSSNTERRLVGMHWFDCFELACRTQVGPHIASINSGKGGDSTRDLLARIDRDCLAHHPDLVFITVGGNDSNPAKEMARAEYKENLRNIIDRIRSIGGEPVLQTYYAFDLENMNPHHAETFTSMMQAVREMSKETDCMLIDHLARWEPLRQRCVNVYRRLLCDALHTNPTGNIVLGLDIARAFGLELPDDACFREGRGIQALLDILAGASESRA